MASVLASLFWTKSLSLAETTSEIVNFMFLMPFIAAIAGIVFLDEKLTPATIIGGIIAFFLILLSMFIGSYVSTFLNHFLNFPNYIGPMIVAAILRNVTDHTSKFDLHYEEIHILEDVSLNLFLGMAMISLKLWELSSVAGQLATLLLAQAVLAWVFIYFVTFRVMGGNYDAAVLSAGHVGFGLGATPNGIANMQSVCDKYKHSHIAFFVMPIVGALFIDFFNVAIISGFFSFLSR